MMPQERERLTQRWEQLNRELAELATLKDEPEETDDTLHAERRAELLEELDALGEALGGEYLARRREERQQDADA